MLENYILKYKIENQTVTLKNAKKKLISYLFPAWLHFVKGLKKIFYIFQRVKYNFKFRGLQRKWHTFKGLKTYLNH